MRRLVEGAAVARELDRRRDDAPAEFRGGREEARCRRGRARVFEAMSFQPHRGSEPLISVEEAQSRVLAAIGIIDTEVVTLGDALNRVLREGIAASHDIPSGDNSAMDGYAVRAEDVANAPVTLRVIDDIPAGRLASGAVEPGTAMRIMTGALLPDGADAIVQVELTDGGTDAVHIRERVTRGTNIRKRGEDMRAGDLVLRAGTRIGPGEIGVLAGAQRGSVVVSRRPTIAILSTGDELVEVGDPLGAG